MVSRWRRFLRLDSAGGWLPLRRGRWRNGVSGAQGGAKGGGQLRRACLEVTGERGEPQPQEWKSFSAIRTRGEAVREVVASGDVIVSQRTPLKGYAGVGSAAGDRSHASQPGFGPRVRDRQQAGESAKRLGFSWVDYTLRANAASGAPMWILRASRQHGNAESVRSRSRRRMARWSCRWRRSRRRPHGIAEQFSDSPTGQENWGLSRQGGRNGGRSRQYREGHDSPDRGNGSGISDRRTDHWAKRLTMTIRATRAGEDSHLLTSHGPVRSNRCSDHCRLSDAGRGSLCARAWCWGCSGDSASRARWSWPFLLRRGHRFAGLRRRLCPDRRRILGMDGGFSAHGDRTKGHAAKKPSGRESAEKRASPAELLGAQGRSLTPLRPAGTGLRSVEERWTWWRRAILSRRDEPIVVVREEGMRVVVRKKV